MRATLAIRNVPDDGKEDVSKLISELCTRHSTRAATASAAKAEEPTDDEQDESSASRHKNMFESGEVNKSWFALVNEPISKQKAIQIFAGKATLEKEGASIGKTLPSDGTI